jgi:hypothetical protein
MLPRTVLGLAVVVVVGDVVADVIGALPRASESGR